MGVMSGDEAGANGAGANRTGASTGGAGASTSNAGAIRDMDVALGIADPGRDAAELLAVYAPYVRDTFITFEYEVPSVEEFAGRIAGTLERFPYIVARDAETGRALGYAYVSTFHARPAYDWTVETSIYVDREARGRHVGKQLHDALERACLAQGIRSLEACISYPDQGGSIGFHEREGYRMVGRFEACGFKLGAWRDMVWMEKHIAEHASAPDLLKTFPQVRAEVEAELGIARG